MHQIKYIRLDKLRPPEFDHRITSSPQDDDDLRDSIRELGILEPLTVSQVGDGYQIIFGNRRCIQAGRAGLASVPCIVSKATGAEIDKIQLHENIKRLPLSHIDQGYTFAHMIKQYTMTEQQVATLVGKSTAYVCQHLSLIQSDEVLVNAVQNGRINFSVARELCLCKDSDDRHRLQHIAETNGATQSVVRNWVQESNRESDLIAGYTPKPTPFSRPVESAVPMFPCAACEVPIPISDLKMVRLCNECHYLIFHEIEREKFKQRTTPV